MSRFYLRLILLALLIFIAALLFIRAQPYDDHELRDLLLPANCPAPCFMGIRPGVTTMDDAIKILESSGWVEPHKNDFDNWISFKWNGHQPDLMMDNDGISLSFSLHPATVTQISFQLQENVSVGDLYLALGMPSSYSFPSGRLLNSGNRRLSLILSHQYEQTLINLTTFTNCPVKLSQLLNQPVKLIQYNLYPQTGAFTISLKRLLRFYNCGG